MSLRRIVVSLDGSDKATLDRMVDLARELEAELVGLFVEDTELLSLAALPFGETGYPTALRRALDVEAMERSLRAQARRIHRELDARLAGNRIKWTFEVVRGRLAAALASIAAEGDIVFVQAARAFAGASGSRAWAARECRDLNVPWLLVSDPIRGDDGMVIVPPAGAALGMVARVVAALAPHYGQSVLLVLDEARAEREKTLPGDLRQLLAERAIAVRIRSLADTSRDDLDRLIASVPRGLVVMLSASAEAREALLVRITAGR